MANRDLIASGNVSDPANWFGGIKPGPGDIARSGGFEGILDEDIECDEIQNTGGGLFVLDSGTRTATATVRAMDGNTDGVIRIRGDSTLTVNGDVFGGDLANRRGIGNGSTGVLTINGNVRGGLGANANGIRLDMPTVKTTTRVFGNVTGGDSTSSNRANGITTFGTADDLHEVEVAGHVIGGNGNSATPALGVSVVRSNVIVWGHVFGRRGRGVLSGGGGGTTTVIFGNVFGSDEHENGAGLWLHPSTTSGEYTIHGSAIGRVAPGVIAESAVANKSLAVAGGVTGGSSAGGHGILSQGLLEIDVRGAAVGGSHPDAHGILNESTGTVRVGGQSITNPSGALGVSNPGGGEVTTEYLAVADPAYLPDVRAAEGGKVLVTLLKNSVNASTLVTGTPTVEVFDFARQSVFGEPKELTLEDGVYSYQHPTSVMTPRKLYYARVEAVIDDEAQDLIERPFVAQ